MVQYQLFICLKNETISYSDTHLKEPQQTQDHGQHKMKLKEMIMNLNRRFIVCWFILFSSTSTILFRNQQFFDYFKKHFKYCKQKPGLKKTENTRMKSARI